MKHPRTLAAAVASLFFALHAAAQTAASELPAEEVRSIAEEAFVYGFPMVMHYKTMVSYVLDESSPEYKAPFNQLSCGARVYTPQDRAVVTPNSDTPYCMGFLDLSDGPVVLRVPELAPERYYSFQLIDLFTHNYAYVGTLSTGNGAADYLLAGPGWEGEAPQSVIGVPASETDIVFAVVRTQLFDEADLENVAKIQSAYALLPLSTYPEGRAAPRPPPADWPVWVEGAQFDARAFTYLNYMLNLVQPSDEERELRARFARIGLGAGAAFSLDDQPEPIRAALEDGARSAFQSIQKFLADHSGDPAMSARIFGTREFLAASAEKYRLGSPYLLRAAAAQAGLYGNSAREAMYPTYFVDSDGAPLDASQRRYTLTFGEGAWPPVKAFWSVTMYDARTQLLVENPLHRYLLNSAMADDFVRGDDGTVTLYVQSSAPPEAQRANWLPAPEGPFYLVMRLYGPEEAALAGDWSPPPLVPAPTDDGG